MLKHIFIILILLSVCTTNVNAREKFFKIQSVDTVKYSRDLAREKINDNNFYKEIDDQIKNIALTGATHVAIGTPYDEEFFPYLKQWVEIARKYKLNVWFRGNWSGWEGWFDYPKFIDRNNHIDKTWNFIINHQDIFEDGDVFTACPECENGGPGDPRKTGDVAGFRTFLIQENSAMGKAFSQIGKNVIFNYNSMNGDVARLIMDKATTKTLGGVVTIDHYVATPQKLITDINSLAGISHGGIVLGEFGVPIPDIQGNLNQEDQSKWVDEALKGLARSKNVIAVNYWTNKSSSTALWNDDGTARQVVITVQKYYAPVQLTGTITDNVTRLLSGVTVKTKEVSYTAKDGTYAIPVLAGETVLFTKRGYVSVSIMVDSNPQNEVGRNIALAVYHPSWLDQLLMKITAFFRLFSSGTP